MRGITICDSATNLLIITGLLVQTSEMDTIDASSCVRKEISKDTIIKNNIAIRNFHLDDLFYLEKDLDFNEKVC